MLERSQNTLKKHPKAVEQKLLKFYHVFFLHKYTHYLVKKLLVGPLWALVAILQIKMLASNDQDHGWFIYDTADSFSNKQALVGAKDLLDSISLPVGERWRWSTKQPTID